jgi:hypothetical protein
MREREEVNNAIGSMVDPGWMVRAGVGGVE